MNWRQLPSNVVTRSVPGKDLDSFTRWDCIELVCSWSCSHGHVELRMHGVFNTDCLTHYMEWYHYNQNNNFHSSSLSNVTYTQEHIADCKFIRTPCPNKQHGCTKLLLQSQWEEHLERECRFIPVQCPWCSKKVHNKEVISKLRTKFSVRGILLSESDTCHAGSYQYFNWNLFPQHHIKQECGLAVVSCSNGCGERLARKDVCQCYTLLYRCMLETSFACMRLIVSE
jgi:hypothetical protein